MQVLPNDSTLLGLDVGNVRIGIAAASLIARLPHPLTTLPNDANFLSSLQAIIASERVSGLVAGLPRNLQGSATVQTEHAQSFMETVQAQVALPVFWQDEALTSAKAEKELESRGKPYQRGDIDALAATYILDDFLTEHPGDVTV